MKLFTPFEVSRIGCRYVWTSPYGNMRKYWTKRAAVAAADVARKEWDAEPHYYGFRGDQVSIYVDDVKYGLITMITWDGDTLRVLDMICNDVADFTQAKVIELRATTPTHLVTKRFAVEHENEAVHITSEDIIVERETFFKIVSQTPFLSVERANT